MVKRQFFLISMLLSPSLALACLSANSIAYQASLSQEGKHLAITLKDPNGESRQYLDDVGYLGLHVAVTFMYKTATSTTLDLSANKASVDFMKQRLALLRSNLEAYLGAKEKAQIMPAVQEFEKLLKQNTVDRQAFSKSFNDISLALYQAGVHPTVRSRKIESDPWGPEETINKLIANKIPTYTSMRGGCSDTIGSMNFNVRGASTANAASTSR